MKRTGSKASRSSSNPTSLQDTIAPEGIAGTQHVSEKHADVLRTTRDYCQVFSPEDLEGIIMELIRILLEPPEEKPRKPKRKKAEKKKKSHGEPNGTFDEEGEKGQHCITC